MEYTQILDSLKSCLAIRYTDKKIYQKKTGGGLGHECPNGQTKAGG